jgi:adenine-specific DNA-methyltransferase
MSSNKKTLKTEEFNSLVEVLKQKKNKEKPHIFKLYHDEWHVAQVSNEASRLKAEGKLPQNYDYRKDPAIMKLVNDSDYVPAFKNVLVKGDNLDFLRMIHSDNAKKYQIGPVFGNHPNYDEKKRDENLNKYSLYERIQACRLFFDTIYLDPPYNSKNSGLIYDDRRRDWIEFMSERLELSLKLLTPNGIMFISIDDQELVSLMLLLQTKLRDEYFELEVCVNKTGEGNANSSGIAIQHEYLIIIYKTPSATLRKSEKIRDKTTSESILNRYGEKPTKNMTFPFYYSSKTDKLSVEPFDGHTDEILPKDNLGSLTRWSWSKKKALKDLHQLKVKIRNDNSLGIHKVLTEGSKITAAHPSLLNFNTKNGTQALKKMLPGSQFKFAKDPALLRHILSMTGGMYILDLFGGSGTMAQAVYEHNKAKGLIHTYFIVSNNEGGIFDKITLPRSLKAKKTLEKDAEYKMPLYVYELKEGLKLKKIYK